MKEKAKVDDDAELWKRLDELEHEEEKSKQEEYEEINAATGDDKRPATNVINVSHTSHPVTSTSKYTPSGVINSPADICVKKSPTASDSTIHTEQPATKSKSVHWSSDVTSLPTDKPVEISATSKVRPFTGSVIEKASETIMPAVSFLLLCRFFNSSLFFRTQDVKCLDLKHLDKPESIAKI